MKTLEELESTFEFFKHNKDRSKTVDKGVNWKIVIFRPFERDGEKVYSYRLYGKVEGSRYKEYNDKLQFCGGAYYKLNLKTQALKREVYRNKLHSCIVLKIKRSELLAKL